MSSLNLVQAVNQGLRTALRRDEKVIVLGEDVGRSGGVFRATEGLQEEFGSKRVMDAPLSELGIVGTAIGMAMYGLRPVVEIQFIDFIYPAFDQIVNELAKLRYRTGGQWSAPVVIRTIVGGGIRGGMYHSQSSEAYFTHTSGLKVVIPSTPGDAKGMLLAAIDGEDPVIFLEPKRLYRSTREDVPDEYYAVPLGAARISRAGADVSILTYGAMVPVALEAAAAAAKTGIETEVIDLRTLVPLDVESMLASVRKTGRVVIVHEAPKTSGFGAELAATIAEHAVDCLKAPILRVTGYDTPFPFSLEGVYLPSPQRVLRAIERVARC